MIKAKIKKLIRAVAGNESDSSTVTTDRIDEVCRRLSVPRLEPADLVRDEWKPLFPKQTAVPSDFPVKSHDSIEALVHNRSMEGYFSNNMTADGLCLTDTGKSHHYRVKMILAVLNRWCDGSLKGLSFLDIGCSSGYYCFHADRLGAESVLGLDARPEHEEQFRLLHRMTGARDTCRYQHLDMEYGMEPFDQTHDVVSAQGVLYHLFDHPRFVKNLHRLTKKLVILEGACCGRTDELCRPLIENPKDLRESIHGPVLYPSLAWMIDVMRWAGFKDVTYINYPADLPPSKAHQGLWRAMLVGIK